MADLTPEEIVQWTMYFEEEGVIQTDGDKLYFQGENVQQRRSAQESVKTALRRIEATIQKGVCINCAISMVAWDFGIERDNLETLWIDSKVDQLPDHPDVSADDGVMDDG